MKAQQRKNAILSAAEARGYVGLTLEESQEVISKNARRVSVPPINLDEQADVSSVLIPTKRQQEQRDGVNKLTEGVARTKAKVEDSFS